MCASFFDRFASGKNRDIRLAGFSKLIPFSIFSIFMILCYASGILHLFPHAFAVDNQDRVYLLFTEGGYCVTEYGVIKVLPKFDEASTISISDENLLSYARNDEITVYDINTSNPEMGKLVEIDRYTTSDKDALFASRRLRNGDEQNGVTYAYDQNLFSYQITRVVDGEASLFYRMPTLDVIWNLLKMSYIPLMIVSILRAILYHARALLEEQNKVTD
jgi:hypothetical protein